MLFEDEGAPRPEGDTPSWFTPLDYYLERERQLIAAGLIGGPFDLDPCGHVEAPVSRHILEQGGTVYTAEDNGLERSWYCGRPFINPPFDSPSITAFLDRLYRAQRGAENLKEAVVHCPAWTDRRWWHQYIEPDRRAGRCIVWFEPGRLTYGWPGNPDAIAADNGAKFASALIVWPVKP